MTDIIEAETVKAPATVDVYVLMIWYPHDGWTAVNTFPSPESCRHAYSCKQIRLPYRIVRVSGLPVDVPKGEV